MTTTWQEAIRPAAETIVRECGLPGLAIAVAREDAPLEHLTIGVDGAGRLLAADSLFPIASISKLAVALAILRLAAGGALRLDDPVARPLPDAAVAGEDVTPRALLCHTAGFPDDVASAAAPYAPGLDWPTLARACLSTALVRAPWTRVHYSNVGPGLLGIIVERLTGKPYSDALAELVLTPLGVEGYLGVELPREPARVGGELGDHAGTDLEPFNSAFWRGLAMPWGGLVTTISGALALVRAFAGQPAGFLPPALLAEATRDQTRGLPGGMIGLYEWPRNPWGLGVDLLGDKEPHWAPLSAGTDSFGHAGASGCLAWYDPERRLAWAFHGLRTVNDWYNGFPSVTGAILAALE
jgi:CubicO group peptidase (beta-lactamase class C family)